MGKLGKVFGVIFLLFVVVIVGLFAVVKIYLTEERVKELVVPQAESALGRVVLIGDIKIGLFSGITIKDFIVKEENLESNFVTTKAFVLSYDLMPLLQKKLVVSEIRFDEPTIQITRNKKGEFNYSTLALLAKSDEAAKPKTSSGGAAALPLALTIDQIRLVNARLSVRDALQELPKVDATTNAKLKISIGQNLADLRYQGDWDLVADAQYAETKVHVDGSGNISQQDLDVDIGITLDEEKVQIQGDIKSYANSPNANLAISSKSLNIDKLLAMAGALPKSQAVKPAAPKSTAPIADSLPPGIVAKGTVKVDKAMYKGLTANDFALAFDIEKGILTVSELSAKAYGGTLDSSINADLNKPDPVYDGQMSLNSMQADGLTSSLIQKAAGMLTGSLASSVNFSGAGTTWDKMKNVLTADGTFSLENGSIAGTPATKSVANLLGLAELNNVTYKHISGTFTIVEGGKAKLKTQLAGDDVSVDADGIIGLDGSLDMPLTIHLSPAMAEKFKSRSSFAQYLSDGEGGSTLNLKLAGTVTNPKPTLDMKGVQDQLQKTLQNKLLEQGGDIQTDGKSSPENIIKGLFGK